MHGIKEMKSSAVSDFTNIKPKAFMGGHEHELAPYPAIIAAPLAEEEHISSATSITEYDKLSSFATSVAEDQSITSVTAPQTEEAGRNSLLLDTINSIPSRAEAIQGKDYLHSAGTISPTSSLEDDKCFKSPSSDEYQPNIAELEGDAKIKLVHEEDDEEEEEDEDQTPNVDIPLGKLQEGYEHAASMMLQEKEKSPSATFSPPSFTTTQYSPIQAVKETQGLFSTEGFKTGSDIKSVSPPPSFSPGLESHSRQESEERCLSPDDSTMRLASPTQSVPTSSGYSPTEEKPFKTEDKDEAVTDVKVDSHKTDKSVSISDSTSYIGLIGDKPAMEELRRICLKTMRMKMSVTPKRICSPPLRPSLWRQKRDDDQVTVDSDMEKGAKEKSEKEVKSPITEMFGSNRPEFMVSMAGYGYNSQGKPTMKESTSGSLTKAEDEAKTDSSSFSGKPMDLGATGFSSYSSGFEYSYGSAEKDSFLSSQTTVKDKDDFTLKSTEDSYYQNDRADPDFEKQKTPDLLSKRSLDTSFQYATTTAPGYSSSSAYSYSSSTSGSLSTSRQFGEELETPAEPLFEYSSFKDEHSLVMDSPFSSSAGAKDDYLEVSEKQITATTTAESTSSLARFSPISPFEEVKSFPPPSLSSTAFAEDKKEHTTSLGGVTDKGPQQSDCFYKPEWSEGSKLDTAVGLGASAGLFSQSEELSKDKEAASAALFGITSSPRPDIEGKHYFEETDSSEEEDEEAYMRLGLATEDTPPTSVSESLASQSDSDVPPGTEEFPSVTGEGNMDSDEDADYMPVDKLSATGGGSYHSSRRSHDPPPAPLMDPYPQPPRPDVCMVDPESLDNSSVKKEPKPKSLKKASGKTKSSSPARRKKSPMPVKQTPSPRSASLKKKEADKSSRMSRLSDGQGSKDDDLSRSSYNPGKAMTNGVKTSSGSQKSGSGAAPGLPIYVDLAYIPNHCSAKNVDQEFFKRIRSAYYVVSGNDTANGEPSRGVLDALLDGKSQWGSNLQVTLIPTHDSEVTRDWYQQTHEKQQELNIMVLASSSTVVMQDESFPACKIEF
ncbi:Microtubule-associated protein 1B [Nibea albiflora]|uniref:Microtubule-associated protein 1B n=1 Tax=Nibea albiflora TaxID=240163 RepID=A0ACB7EGJ8_NIBAL|nr:Microtubule-associated protein 1B [Nibea albiflora]